MNASELRAMKSAELHAELDQLRRHLFDLHSQAVTEKLENPHQLKETQKSIARVLTVLAERGESRVEQAQHRVRSAAAQHAAE